MGIKFLSKIIPTKDNSLKNRKGTMIGATIGVTTGLIDGYYTDCSNKKTVRKALDTYKNFNTATKRETLKTLHAQGISLKEYKEYAEKILDKSPATKMIRNALIYGSLFALVGLAIDKYKSNKKLHNSK